MTKRAHLAERRVLALLAAQGHACVPFSHAVESTLDGPALVCLEDLGRRHRPTSLDPIEPALVRREAAGLAAIHAANAARPPDLAWLPRTDRPYFERQIHQVNWRPAWERAVADAAFVRAFGPSIRPVEAAAARIVDEMAALAAEAGAATLAHTDLNPGNVLIRRGRPYFIDWDAAHHGCPYLDLPHHLHTPDLAEHYRRALTALGQQISAADFAERYRVASRYTALRYMWWALDAWRADSHRAAEWVRHYLGMIERAAG